MAATLARRIAVEVLESAERRKSYVNLALNSRLTADLTKEDRARITDLVYGTSRHLGTIDRHLAPHCRRRLQDLPGPIRAILRLALYEILYTQTPPPVAVDQAVTEPSAYILSNNQEEYAYIGAKWLFEQMGGKGAVV